MFFINQSQFLLYIIYNAFIVDSIKIKIDSKCFNFVTCVNQQLLFSMFLRWFVGATTQHLTQSHNSLPKATTLYPKPQQFTQSHNSLPKATTVYPKPQHFTQSHNTLPRAHNNCKWYLPSSPLNPDLPGDFFDLKIV